MNATWNINDSVSEFLLINGPHLLKNESINNQILGLVDAMNKGQETFDSPLFLTLSDGLKNPSQAIRARENKPLILTDMTEQHVDALINVLISMGITLTGIIGPVDIASYFSKRWAKTRNVKSAIAIRLGIFEVTTPIIPDLRGGEMQRATLADLELAMKYTRGFLKDCFPDDVALKERIHERCLKHINAGNLYFWKSEGRLVSMAALVRESKNAGTLSLVYTPEGERGKGFGKCIVAKLSEFLLEKGKTKCNLFTDLTNPISNFIYPNVGYTLVGKSTHHTFTKV